MRSTDVLIAGGGVIGLMTGWMLVRAGVRATIADSGMPAATDAAAGMLAPSFEGPLHEAGPALADFSRRSLARWRDVACLLAERGGVDPDFREGVLAVAFSEAEAKALRAAGGGACLSTEELRALEPALSPAALAGVYSMNDAQVDPRRVRAGLEKAFLHDGGVLLRGRALASISSDGGRLSGGVLADGEGIAAAVAVIATGARLGGLGDLPAGAVFPVKGEALALGHVDGAPSRVIRTSRAYLCPKADGRIVIGASEVRGDWSLNADSGRVEALRDGAVAAAPALACAPEISRWAGLRPATKDGAPIIGPAPGGPEGLFYALGHYRNGVLLAPATADVVASAILGGGAAVIDAAFSAARFNQPDV